MQTNEKHKELYAVCVPPADSTGSHIRNTASCWCYEREF